MYVTFNVACAREITNGSIFVMAIADYLNIKEISMWNLEKPKMKQKKKNGIVRNQCMDTQIDKIIIGKCISKDTQVKN